jgi:hypothetical protein
VLPDKPPPPIRTKGPRAMALAPQRAVVKVNTVVLGVAVLLAMLLKLMTTSWFLATVVRPPARTALPETAAMAGNDPPVPTLERSTRGEFDPLYQMATCAGVVEPSQKPPAKRNQPPVVPSGSSTAAEPKPRQPIESDGVIVSRVADVALSCVMLRESAPDATSPPAIQHNSSSPAAPGSETAACRDPVSASAEASLSEKHSHEFSRLLEVSVPPQKQWCPPAPQPTPDTRALASEKLDQPSTDPASKM